MLWLPIFDYITETISYLNCLACRAHRIYPLYCKDIMDLYTAIVGVLVYSVVSNSGEFIYKPYHKCASLISGCSAQSICYNVFVFLQHMATVLTLFLI